MSAHLQNDVSPDDLDVCASLQQEEWEVLESIFPDCVSSDSSSRFIMLEIPVDLEDKLVFLTFNDGHLARREQTEEQVLKLSGLPPLLIQVTLPSSYPLHCPPQLTSIRSVNSWLSDFTLLQQKLTSMWAPGENLLYDWVEFIRSGEFLRSMDMEDSNGNIRILHQAPLDLIPLLKSYDQSLKQSKFTQNTYDCSICLTEQRGLRCLRLSCQHIFCRTCLEDFWKLCILEGEVGRVGCPDPACVKEAREATEEEVARVVTEAEVTRWRWLREKRDFERDPGNINCPISFCQNPVRKPPVENDGDEESGWNRLRTCPSCSYSFCAFCRRTWHGPITDCPISNTETLVLEYLALPEDSPERKVIEMRFGRKTIKKLVLKFEEEKANRDWLKASTMACPGCDIHVEKSLGCNHMTCSKCKQHFCYLCGEKLSAANPYVHFSTPGLRCFSKLFDFQSGEDDEWQPVEGFDLL